MLSSHVSSFEQTEAIRDAMHRYHQYNGREPNNVTMGVRVYQRVLQETYSAVVPINQQASQQYKGKLYGMNVVVDRGMDAEAFNVYYAEGLRTEPIYAPLGGKR